MSDSTPRLGLPDLPDTPELYADTVADAFARLDAFTDLCLKGVFVNTPPSSPGDGDAYLTGASPTGAWSGYAYKIATCRDGGWTMLTPFDGLRAFVPGSSIFLVYCAGLWTDWNALISAAETSIASAATCDVGAADSLFVAVTGTTPITSLGTAANRLRHLRFAGALTLTHDATSLILPGGASIATAAGDTALFASDGSGNWRCRHYSRASGQPVATALAPSSLSVSGLSTGGGGMRATGNAVAGGSGPAAELFWDGSTANLVSYDRTSAAYQPLFVGGSSTILGAAGGGVATIDASGLGVGASAAGFGKLSVLESANTPLYVWARSTSSGASATAGFVANAYGNSWFVGCGSTANNGNALDFRVDPTGSNMLAGRMSTSGNFMLGTGTDGGWTGNARSSVQSAAVGLSVYVTGSSGIGQYNRVDNAAVPYQSFHYGATQVGTIATTGTATSYLTTSDERLKDWSIAQADYRAAIKALWVGDFAWKACGSRAFGVRAQQAYTVMPHHLGVTRPADDAGQWHASAEPFGHLALWGVKDLYAMIDTLAARIAALEAAHAAG